MRVILDTDKKTITVPWNYRDKLEAMNAIIAEATTDKDKQKDFMGYLQECWDEAFKGHIQEGKKPVRKEKK